MLTVAFNSRKGYFVPKKEQWVTRRATRSTIVTNGFDQLDVAESTAGDEPISETEDGGIVYDEPTEDFTYKSEGPINDKYVTFGDHNLSDDDIDETTGHKSGKKGRRLTREERKEARLAKKQGQGKGSGVKKGRAKNKKDKNDDIEYNFIDGNDSNKISLLKKLYSQINSRFPESNTKVIQYYDITIYKEEAYNLQDDEWINDNNISFMYEFLERFYIEKFVKKLSTSSFNTINSNSIILLRPSMVYLLAHCSDASGLKGVLPALEKSRFIFLPINDNDDVELAEGGSHWSLVVISTLESKAFFYDTLQTSNYSESMNVVKKIGQYMELDHPIDTVNVRTPQQINGSDCGVLICQITALLVDELIHCPDDTLIDLRLDRYKISAIDGRIFMLGSLVNLMNAKGLL